MKPLFLEMTAFGPYADTQALDFRKLHDRSLFLIHGPTGSGKTSILDAICFALFGDSSGGERTGRHLRSDHAAPDRETSVTFEFSIGSDRYRISRRPSYERPKLRSEGTTSVSAKASMWKLNGAGNTDSSEPIARTASAVTQQSELVLGLRSDQFRQVVMLPQGQFRRLLTADSRDRQAILDTLFRTAFYGEIEKALREARAELKSEIDSVTDHMKLLIEQADVESAEELDRVRQNKARESASIEKQIKEATEAERAASAALHAAKQTESRFTELSVAESACAALEDRLEEFAEKRVGIDRARKADSLRAEESNLLARKKEAEAAEEGLRAAKAAVTEADRTRESALQSLNLSEQALKDRDPLSKRITELESFQESVGKLADAKRAATAAERNAGKAQKEHAAAVEHLESLNVDLEKRREELQAARTSASHVEHLQAQVESEAKVAERVEKLRSLEKKHKKAATGLAADEKALADVTTDLSAARGNLSELQRSWNAAQAAILAGKLSTGEPCPVCGATEHPNPAARDTSAPNEHEIEAQSRLIEELEARREKAAQQCSDAKTALARIEADLEALRDQLGERVSASSKELNAGLDALRARLKACEQDKRRAEKLEKDIAGIEEDLKKAQKTKDLADTTLREAHSEADLARGRLVEREQAAPEQWRDPKVLQKALKETRGRLHVLDGEAERARKAFNEAEKRLSGAIGTLNAAKKTEELARRSLEESTAAFQTRVREQGFADEYEYRSARMDPHRVDAMEEELKTYHETLAAARDRRRRAVEATSNLERPDVEAMERTARAAQEALRRIVERRAELKAEMERFDRLARDYRKNREKCSALEERFSIVGDLADTALGRNDLGLAFQRFVLSALLDDVLLTASERLQRMSGSRFSLHRAADREDKRTAGGLDLEVFDTYTGTRRPVATLSGGESFLASLSLALGLADVVQAYAGGIRLETIFIDEGFGSLDPESLDLAYKTLVDLRQGGRLVGVISHVGDMKEMIRDRLDVRPGPRGSTADFVIS